MTKVRDKLTISSIVKQLDNHLACSLGEDGIAILNIDNNKRFSLDPVGERIWSLSKNSIRVRDIVTLLTQEYDVPSEECEKDTISLLVMLWKAGLIAIDPN